MTALLARLRHPPFGTETSERELFTAAADEIERLTKVLRDLDCSEILGVAESCASGMPRWDFVNERITRARAAIREQL